MNGRIRHTMGYLMAVLLAMGWVTSAVAQGVSEGEIVKLLGHTDVIGSIDFSPDGSRVVTTSGDRTMRIWDSYTGEELVKVVDSSGPLVFVHALYTKDGKRIISWSNSGDVRVWKAETGELENTFPIHTQAILSGAVSSDGKFVVTGSRDLTARIWDVATGEELHLLGGHTQGVYCVAFSPDGRYVFTGGLDSKAKLWNANTGEEIRTFDISIRLLSASFSQSGDSLLACGPEGFLVLFDVNTEEALHAYEGLKYTVKSVEFSPDGAKMVFVPDYNVRVWEIGTEREVYLWTGNARNYSAATFSPDGNRLAILPLNDTAYVWTLPPPGSAAIPAEIVTGENLYMQIHPNPVRSRSEIEIVNPAPGPVRLSVVDELGRERMVLLDETAEAGAIMVPADMTVLPDGAYFCVMRKGNRVTSRPVVVRH